MELGKEYFYIKQQDQSIKSGVLISFGIAMDSGYVLGYFPIEEKEGKNIDRIEEGLIFETKEEAEAHLEVVKPWRDEAQVIEDDANGKIAVLREKIIGQPRFKHLLGK